MQEIYVNCRKNLGQLCRAADLYCPRMLLAAAAGGAKGSRCFGKRPSKARLKRKKSRSGRQIVVKRLRGGLFIKIKSPESVGTQGFQWSCWADSNRRPHPYQLIGRIGFAAFRPFCTLFAPGCHPFRNSCVHCLRPLVSPCGSRCGSKPATRQRMDEFQTKACQGAVPCPAHR